MTKKILQIEGIEAEALFARFDRLEAAIASLSQSKPARTHDQSDYLTRRELAKRLSVTFPTLHDWTRKGILKAYRMGKRVYYKASEVEDRLDLLN
ncbi:MAG: helix-turn-helix domain-containing protein [Bacteroidales bacterium]